MITPPTDSLYKFVAISGLLILAWGVAYPWNKGVEYELKVAETKAEIRKATAKIESLKSLYTALESEKKRLDKEPRSAEIEAKTNAIEVRKHSVYVEMIEAQQPVDMRADVIKVMESALRSYQLMGFISTLAGFLLALIGFALWYRRVQKYIDEEVQHH